MRALSLLRRTGTVRTIHRGKQRILAVRCVPARPDGRHRNTHAFGRLMTGDTRPAVTADRLEERMAAGVQRTRGIEYSHLACWVVKVRTGAQCPALSSLPPGGGIVGLVVLGSGEAGSQQQQPQHETALRRNLGVLRIGIHEPLVYAFVSAFIDAR